MIITTWQKHQLSDLSLRLSLDGQNIENVIEHRLLGLTVDKKFDGKPRSNTYAKACQNKIIFFLNCNIPSASIPENSSTTLT